VSRVTRPRRDSAQTISPKRSGGPEGNERLTAMTGAVLLILLAVECYTIVRIGRSAHRAPRR
jgi:hypothetical protein